MPKMKEVRDGGESAEYGSQWISGLRDTTNIRDDPGWAISSPLIIDIAVSKQGDRRPGWLKIYTINAIFLSHV